MAAAPVSTAKGAPSPAPTKGARTSAVDLFWIPLGSGASFVRFNGRVYEYVKALVEGRPRYGIYHSALQVDLPSGRFMVEMTPIPSTATADRGVVTEGAVGAKSLGRWRVFRYEVRRWLDGAVPDLAYAVASPVRVTDETDIAVRVFDLLPRVPPLVWGRDERRTGDMWSCNSVISWTLATAGVDVASIPFPPGGRAPGWAAGVAVAAADADVHAPAPTCP